MNRETMTKKRWRWLLSKIWIGNFAIVLITYAVYIFNAHYSEDSFEAMLNIGAMADVNLRNGRVIHYFLYTFLNNVGFNILEHQQLIQVMMTIVLTTGITIIGYSFTILMGQFDIKRYIAIDITFLFLFLNPCFLFGWYYWPETCIGASVSLIVTFLAIFMWCREKLNWKYVLGSFIFLCISISMYQVYVELYVGVCLAYTLLKYSCKLKKNAVVEYITIVIFGGVASIANIMLMSFLQKMNIIYKDDRSATLSKEIIFNNLRTVWQNQHVIWHNMNGFLPDHYLEIIALVTVFMIVIGMYRRKDDVKIVDILFFFLILITVYGLAFMPNLISGTVWLAPRTYIGLFAFLQIEMLYVLFQLQKSINIKKIYISFLGIFLLVMIFRLLELQTNTIVSNRFDEYEIKTIGEYIAEYEESTENQVDTILFAYDGVTCYKYDEVNYVAYDNNVRGMAYSWCFSNMIKYYLKEEMVVEEMPSEDYQKYFKNQQWDEFRPEQQLHFEENRLYIAIY